MKRVLLYTMALFVLLTNQVKAADIDTLTTDSKIANALVLLEQNGMNDVLNNLENNSTQIIFYDLSLISFSYAKHYAIASTDENGNNYILINEKYKSSSTQAIACLIAHESAHNLSKATFEEEVKATTTEAKCWIKLETKNINNANDELTQRLNRLAQLYTKSTLNNNYISDSISNNSFYQEQLALK